MADTGFWSYAQRLYEEEGVADACVWLQDNRDLDVVMLLFCLWCGAEQGLSDPELMDKALARCADWHEQVVSPLRGVRRWLKANGFSEDQETLRQAIKAQELAAEKRQIAVLENLVTGAGTSGAQARRNRARANLGHYLNAASVIPDADCIERLEVLLAAAS